MWLVGCRDTIATGSSVQTAILWVWGYFPLEGWTRGNRGGKASGTKYWLTLKHCWLKLYSGFPKKLVFTLYPGFKQNMEQSAKFQWCFLAANFKFRIYCSISPKLDNHLALSGTINKILNCESLFVIENLTKTCPPRLLCWVLAGFLVSSGAVRTLWSGTLGWRSREWTTKPSTNATPIKFICIKMQWINSATDVQTLCGEHFGQKFTNFCRMCSFVANHAGKKLEFCYKTN